MTRSRKIKRQLRRAFDTEDVGLLKRLGSNHAADVLLTGFDHFLDQVEASYAQSDEKLKLAARNLQISTDELTEANRELESLNAAMRSILGGLGQALISFGPDGVCGETYSSACLTLLGASPAGLPEDARPQFQAAVDLAFGGAATFDEVMAAVPPCVTQPDGRMVGVSYRPIRDHAGRLMSILAIATVGP